MSAYSQNAVPRSSFALRAEVRTPYSINVDDPAPLTRGRLWLHRFALLLAACTLFLIVAGGMVTSTGSGLAVPDWPTTYGQNMFTYPYSKWVGGIFYEHGHRLVASAVGMMTIVLAVWMTIVEPRRWMRNLGWAALGAVVVQGILGGLTVRYLLPTSISVFHGCLAQSFLCLVVSIALMTSPGWLRASPRVDIGGGYPVTRLCAMLVGVVFVQLLLGAIMRHTGSGLAVPDFPRAYGQWLPNLSAAAVEEYNHSRRWDWRLDQVTVDQIVWHLLHRMGAVVTAAVLMVTCVTMLRRHGGVAKLRRPAIVAMVLLVTQFVLGAYTVWSGRPARIATAHVAVGAALLADVWLMALLAYRHLHVAVSERSTESVILAGASA